MLKTIIKASEIANLTDARYFSAWGVEWLGFCLDETHPNFVNPAEFYAMREWLVGPKIVGEFGPMVEMERLHHMIEELKLDAIQLGSFTKASDVAHLAGHVTMIREQVLENWSDLDQLTADWEDWSDLLEFYLLDLEKNGLSWSELKTKPSTLKDVQQLAKDYPLMLSIPFEAEEYEEMMSSLSLHGLSLKGGEEEKVGYKSFDQLDDIYEVLIDEY
jgi:phosphoribosylanthranilate isomerase